ncbi:hypothetical protein GOBAR_AA01940 [Gossypium barbadense]|uniref:non-specific serine/threonine protein kinase n=1 Tax=Gossypium barbadense TaxID=3634 RepID=A0A2P5YSQ8_GOSBA|nr:hypothetical protein GOBAR_AA01940 [Gossypium barbadense]
MFNLSNIRFFDIGENKIQVNLYTDLAITMPYVEFFSVRGNKISGQIPISITNASNLHVLQFNDNRLSGKVPSLEKLDKLSTLQLAVNDLGHGREGDLNFLCTLINNTKLEFLFISDNNFGEVFPKCVSNFSNTLLRLEIDENKIIGRIPDGIGNLVNLEALFATENQLSGPVPFEIGGLQKLNKFFAHINFLSGTIPHSIGNLSALTEVGLDFNNLQGNIPPSIGKCQSLLELTVSYNNLSGPIPPQLLGVSSMSIILDLSSNDLTGDLPVEVGNMKNLDELYVPQNRLSGLLPKTLVSCVSLEKLYLDGNLFEGPIPSSLSSLRGLEALDVSNNNLSGEIPEFLVRFGALTYLNLFFNNFEGVIPSGGIFKNASATFVEGNSKLCGGIPELHMLRCNLKTSSSNSLRLKVAIIVVTLGVNLAFTCLLILWFRKKKEKQATTTGVEISVLQLSYQNIVGATDGFSTQNLVGSGRFGSVYKGVLEASGAVIAVKVLNLLNRGASRTFLAECEALKNIRHRNLVKLTDSASQLHLRTLMALHVETDGNKVSPISNKCNSARRMSSFLEVFYIGSSSCTPFLHKNRICSLGFSFWQFCLNQVARLKPSVNLFTGRLFSYLDVEWFFQGSRIQQESPRSRTIQEGLATFTAITASTSFKTPFVTDPNLPETNQFCVGASIRSPSLFWLFRKIGFCYKGVLEASGAVIAVKVLNLLNRGASRSFLAECEALKNIRHRNLVKVLTAISGVDYQGNDFKALVYEFMENGSLEEWLHPLIGMNEPETARNLNFFQRVNVAIDVAHALEYLHHYCEEPIIHCDLKPSNILLDEEMVGHISDFGLAKILSADRLNYSANKSSSLGLRGTIGYAPPEYGMGSELSTKGDVYSYGILLLEMFTGKRPTSERFTEGLSLRNFVKAELPERIIEATDPILVEERVTRGTSDVKNSRNDRHLRCLNTLFEIGLTCSAESPNERIDMSDVVTKLCSIRDKFHPTRLRHEVRT